jgi:hypothetical protein
MSSRCPAAAALHACVVICMWQQLQLAQALMLVVSLNQMCVL